MREVEVKAKVVNKDILQSKLTDLGIVLGDPIFQKDTIFVPEGQSALPVSHGIRVLRIREQGGKFLFTLKYSVTDNLDKVERELEISDPTVLSQIILDLGFVHIATVEKMRRKAQIGELEICVDEVNGLGVFIEVEKLVDGEDVTGVQDELGRFLGTCGISDENRVYDGYDVLMFKKDVIEINGNT